MVFFELPNRDVNSSGEQLAIDTIIHGNQKNVRTKSPPNTGGRWTLLNVGQNITYCGDRSLALGGVLAGALASS